MSYLLIHFVLRTISFPERDPQEQLQIHTLHFLRLSIPDVWSPTALLLQGFDFTLFIGLPHSIKLVLAVTHHVRSFQDVIQVIAQL